MKVCIFGASSARIDKEYIDKCEALGYELARRGHSLVYGAGGHGMMGAAARGFKRGGGFVHGVIPEFFREEAVEQIFDGCDEITYTPTMAERKRIMEDLSDAFIIVPGGVGTFEEFFEVLTLKQLGRHEKAMAIFNIAGYYDDLERFLVQAADKKFITFDTRRLYSSFEDGNALIDYIEGYEPSGEPWSRFKFS